MKYYLHITKLSSFIVLLLLTSIAFGQSAKEVSKAKDAANAKMIDKELKSVMKELPPDMRSQVLEYAKRKLATKKHLDSAMADQAKKAAATPKKPQQAPAKAVSAPTPKPATPQAIELKKANSPATRATPTPPKPAQPSYMQEAQSLPTTTVEWGETTYNFGTETTGKVIKHKYTFKNTGEHPLKLTRVKASCGCTTPAYSREEIAPGEEGFIDVSFNSSGKSGPQTKTITVTGNFQPVNMVLKLRGTLEKPAATE